MATASTVPPSPAAATPLKPLRGVRVLSLALNLPGPGALICGAGGKLPESIRMVAVSLPPRPSRTVSAAV